MKDKKANFSCKRDPAFKRGEVSVIPNDPSIRKAIKISTKTPEKEEQRRLF